MSNLSYEAFQDLARAAGSDEETAPHDVFWDDSVDHESAVLAELCDTGSVTVEVAGKKYVVSLQVEPA